MIYSLYGFTIKRNIQHFSYNDLHRITGDLKSLI